MNDGEHAELTLADIRKCIEEYESGLIYPMDTVNGVRFYQVTSDPKWVSALLSPTLIGCIAQKAGTLENTEISNLMKKNTNAKSHPIDRKLNRLYEKLARDDGSVILEEEQHLQIAISRCACVSALQNAPKWESTSLGKRIDRSYTSLVSGIETLTPEGAALADKIRGLLITSLGTRIGRQCLPYTYTVDADHENNLASVLESIDGIKLLTAVVITALNVENHLTERRSDDKDTDALTRMIHQFLWTAPERSPMAGDHAAVPTGTAGTSPAGDQTENVSHPAGAGSRQAGADLQGLGALHGDSDALLQDLERLAREAEYKAIYESIYGLVLLLTSDDARENMDIEGALEEVKRTCRRATSTENLRYAVDRLSNCERVTDGNERLGSGVHLQILVALLSLEIRLISREIDELKEQRRASRARYDRESLQNQIEVKQDDLNEKCQELRQYQQELEQLQLEGLTKDPSLSLRVSLRQDHDSERQ